ncbi:hypothetical protein SBA5_220043 [Candidatus Sulfotelmatomonas gaucii]|uniref:Uncharacterized protein n=1 Tax=Candidatus Sulfuritelmatomonas gaucii TaxID=2043161 RepID=A0A2N9L7C4_9BACT|nr:hypothetical protein SBA5_220043 [Candidatus Sulfotelmatomonas gaucii]
MGDDDRDRRGVDRGWVAVFPNCAAGCCCGGRDAGVPISCESEGGARGLTISGRPVPGWRLRLLIQIVFVAALVAAVWRG